MYKEQRADVSHTLKMYNIPRKWRSAHHHHEQDHSQGPNVSTPSVEDAFAAIHLGRFVRCTCIAILVDRVIETVQGYLFKNREPWNLGHFPFAVHPTTDLLSNRTSFFLHDAQYSISIPHSGHVRSVRGRQHG